MDNKAGQKRKQLINNVKSNISNFWHGWFGDLKIGTKFKNMFKRSSQFFGLLLSLVFASVFAQTCNEGMKPKIHDWFFKPSNSEIFKIIQETAVELNNRCPITLDEYTTLVSVKAGKGINSKIDKTIYPNTTDLYMEYFYEIPLEGSVTNELLEEIRQSQVVTQFCENDAHKINRKFNIALHYTYSDGLMTKSFPVDNSDCK